PINDLCLVRELSGPADAVRLFRGDRQNVRLLLCDRLLFPLLRACAGRHGRQAATRRHALSYVPDLALCRGATSRRRALGFHAAPLAWCALPLPARYGHRLEPAA